MKFRKNSPTVILLTLFLVLSVVSSIPRAYSTELTVQEKALTFLRDVVGLDMAKYEAKLVSYTDLPADASGETKAVVFYNLKFEGSTLEVGCGFSNNAFVSCSINPIEGSPLFVQPATNTLDSARSLLDRYQTFSKASYLQPMRDTLITLTELKPMTTTVGDVKLTITTKDYVYIEWMKTVNGIDNGYNRVILEFVNGALVAFTDTWDLYKVGSSDVKVSGEEAIRIARERAQNYSYMLGNMTVSNMTILDEPVITELTMQDRGNYTLYPLWTIRLCLDKIYPGGVTEIRVLLWADTGEITYIAELGPLGGPPDGENSTVPPTEPSQSQQPNFLGTGLPMEIGYAILAVLVVIAGAAAFLVYFRKTKKTNVKVEKITPEAVT